MTISPIKPIYLLASTPKLKLLAPSLMAIYLSACGGSDVDPDDPLATPTPSQEPTPTVEPTPTPTAAPTVAPTPVVTATPTPTMIPTATPTPVPSIPPTATPEPTATATPTPEPTATPTLEPTATPTPEPTPTATPEPTTTPSPEPTATPTPAPTNSPELSCIDGYDFNQTGGKQIKLNQLGFMPISNKVAIVPEVSASEFGIVSASDNQVVYCGDLSAASTWEPSGESVKQANFSAFNTPGAYKLIVPGLSQSVSFDIDTAVFDEAHKAALKAYYFNRASTALEQQYAGKWQRALGHPDDNVLVHDSAASNTRPTGTSIYAPKGWYDAGDYNKYIVNSGISTYTLLAAYEQFSSIYDNMSVNIPESSNAVPDILDEVMWNLEWMEKMQDDDGGVYHKLTTKNFSGVVMPEQATAQRYVVTKTTSAALNFAAVMSVASRVLEDFSAQFPNKSSEYKAAAEAAWAWAKANPSVLYVQPGDIKTGAYDDSNVNDEFSWAAAELFLLTGKSEYLNEFKSIESNKWTPSWQNVGMLAYLSLYDHGQGKLSAEDYQTVVDVLAGSAEYSLEAQQESAYGVSMKVYPDYSDFAWGSNGGALNQAIVLIYGYKIKGEQKYLDAALGNLDYILGRNAVDISFVTGLGDRSAMHPHHRPSEADSVAEPVPGFVVGGPNRGQEDAGSCSYPSSKDALSYVDDWCSYASNEVTINWNAPLVYMMGAIRAYSQ